MEIPTECRTDLAHERVADLSDALWDLSKLMDKIHTQIGADAYSYVEAECPHLSEIGVYAKKLSALSQKMLP